MCKVCFLVESDMIQDFCDSYFLLIVYFQNSTIVALINELYKKIRAIEKETSSSASTTPIVSQAILDKVPGLETQSLDHVENLKSRFNDMKQSLETCTIEDVTKKYYTAFPALDKEFTDTCDSNKNLDQQRFPKGNNSRRASTVVSPNQSLSWSGVFNKNTVEMNQQQMSSAAAAVATKVNKDNAATGLNSLKRKTRRKRAGKTRSFYINRKPSSSLEDGGASLWDMNFEGNWEMGQDLISDFVMNQQHYHQQSSSSHHHKRNRSISEGDFPMSGKQSVGNHRRGTSNTGHHKHNKAFYERQRTLINNNNEEDVQDLYHKSSGSTKEDVAYHLPKQLLPSEQIVPPPIINFQFNNNVVNAHKKEIITHEKSSATVAPEQDYILELKTKFDKIKSIWDDVQDPFNEGIDTIDAAPARNVWEPLNEPTVIPYYDQMSIAWASVPTHTLEFTRDFGAPKQQLDDYDFIKCGTNLQTSIWSNDGNGETKRNLDDALHCREIFDQASDTDSCYFSSLNTTLNPLPTNEKRGSHISLSNHSEHSMFTEVVASKKGSSNNLLAQVPANPVDDCKANDEVDAILDKEDENLLTSDKTHFKPIAYPDGYTFDISNNLDDVKFYRSDSGSLFLDSEQYMELRMDHMRDEFYGFSHVEPANNDDEMRDANDPDEKFVVKFCVRQNEKCCQTDEQELDNVGGFGQLFATDMAFDHFRTSWRYSEQVLSDTRIDFSGDSFTEGDDDSVMSSKCIWSNAEGLNNNSGHTEHHRLWEACNTCQVR